MCCTVRRNWSLENRLHKVHYTIHYATLLMWCPPYSHAVTAALINVNVSIRTGKRTRWGLMMDGWNSMIRYYKNNFSDGFRQVSHS